eukprot:CCRYP_015443-RA/>CCRYP_015443-RA protein AED:0.31 eAED:0.31 QI:1028/1/1/1/1/1/2/366/386
MKHAPHHEWNPLKSPLFSPKIPSQGRHLRIRLQIQTIANPLPIRPPHLHPRTLPIPSPRTNLLPLIHGRRFRIGKPRSFSHRPSILPIIPHVIHDLDVLNLHPIRHRRDGSNTRWRQRIHHGRYHDPPSTRRTPLKYTLKYPFRHTMQRGRRHPTFSPLREGYELLDGGEFVPSPSLHDIVNVGAVVFGPVVVEGVSDSMAVSHSIEMTVVPSCLGGRTMRRVVLGGVGGRTIVGTDSHSVDEGGIFRSRSRSGGHARHGIDGGIERALPFERSFGGRGFVVETVAAAADGVEENGGGMPASFEFFAGGGETFEALVGGRRGCHGCRVGVGDEGGFEDAMGERGEADHAVDGGGGVAMDGVADGWMERTATQLSSALSLAFSCPLG